MGRNREVIIWDAATGQEIFALHGHAKPVRYAAFNSTGRWLATCGADGKVLLYDTAALE